MMKWLSCKKVRCAGNICASLVVLLLSFQIESAVTRTGSIAEASQSQVRLDWPVLMDGIFTVVNGESTGYLELWVGVSVPETGYRILDGVFDLRLLDPKLDSGKIHLKYGRSGKFTVPVTTETTVDGKKKKIKSVKTPRAGPGEQIVVGFYLPVDVQYGRAEVVVEYFSDAGISLGRTNSFQLGLRTNQRAAKSLTFRRSDLSAR